MFFGYDPDSGFNLFKTEAEAKSFAQDAIDYYKGESCDGWDEQVDQVCWGKVMQETVMTNKRECETPHEKEMFSFICDYELKDIKS
ncbi:MULTISPECIES: hypothetical protein [Gammaproteobacteria]|uniref:hypothetical protein n=1 Tax=Gammaproteobacteria TaxID=1236 RepID=UPI002FC9FBD8